MNEAERTALLDSHHLGMLSRIGLLVLQEPNLDVVLREAMRDMGQSLGLSRCAVLLLGDPGKAVEHCDAGFLSAETDFPLYWHLARRGEASTSPRNIIVDDTHSCPHFEDRREDLDRFRVGSFVGIPLQREQEPAGFLFLCRAEPHTWSEIEIMTAEAVARGISIIAHHARIFHRQEELTGRLFSLMNNIPGAVYRGLPDWSLTFIGVNVKRITGYAPEEFQRGTEKWRDLIHPDDIDPVKCAFREAVKEKRQILRVEYRVRHRDGSIRWLEDHRQLVYDAAGNFVYVDGLLLDISDLKRSEEERRASEHHFRAIADTASDAIISADSAGRIVFFNPAAGRLFGYTLDEMKGKQLLGFIPERYRSAHAQGMERFRETGESRMMGTTVELFGLKKDGTEFPLELSLATWKAMGNTFFTAILRDNTLRKREEEELRAAKEKFHALIEASPLAIVALTTEGKVSMWNRAAEQITGWREEEVLGLPLPIVPDEKKAEFHGLVKRAGGGESLSAVELCRKKKDGSPLDISIWTSPIRGQQGEVISIMSVWADVTERIRMEAALRKSEEQLRLSQRLEAIGRLAGGVAHDFNNLLTAICGYSDLLLQRIEAASPMRREVEEIHKAGERASSLTRQLLAFSRKQVMQPKVLELNAVVAGMDNMLRRLIGEDINLVTVLKPELWNVKVDPGQIEQVLMNLVVNARDAMPKGGKVTIETANVELDDQYIHRHPVVKPGPYAMLAISDTGTGMDELTKIQIFEPFFTTKEKGKGTGLGLSTVYGIVKQSGGYIWVYSEIGKGATFKVYLPRFGGTPDGAERGKASEPAPHGKETVLLVEDEEAVRSLVRGILERNGYTVLEAGDGDEAQKVGWEHKSSIRLIITDVVMPKMSGREAVESLLPHIPEVKVLYMSGYADEAIVRHGVLESGLPFLQKPFTPDALLRKVRQVLDAPPRGAVTPEDKDIAAVIR